MDLKTFLIKILLPDKVSLMRLTPKRPLQVVRSGIGVIINWGPNKTTKTENQKGFGSITIKTVN